MISDKRAKLAFHYAQILPNWWTIFQAMLKPYPFDHFEATLPPYFIQKLTVKPFSHIVGFPGQLSSKRPKVTWPAPWRLIVLVSMFTPSPSTFPLHRKLSSAISFPWALDKLQWMLSICKTLIVSFVHDMIPLIPPSSGQEQGYPSDSSLPALKIFFHKKLASHRKVIKHVKRITFTCAWWRGCYIDAVMKPKLNHWPWDKVACLGMTPT